MTLLAVLLAMAVAVAAVALPAVVCLAFLVIFWYVVWG